MVSGFRKNKLKEFPRPTRYTTAWLSMSALTHNLGQLRAHLESATRICGVVKADCYGHGWDACLKTIASQVDFLGVATLEEASKAAQLGYCQNILVFSVPAAANKSLLQTVISQNVVLTITSKADLSAVAHAASTTNQRARIHVKIDSGMGRSGVWHAEAVSLIKEVRANNDINLEGLYTHFSSADEKNKDTTHRQFEQFMNVVKLIGGGSELIIHACNSAGTIDLPEYQLDMVRPGIAMYGIQPSSETSQALDLKPILRLTGQLVAIKDVPAGTQIGYGGTYQCPAPTRIGLVQVGYADGYRRAFSNSAEMTLNGIHVPVRGNVSMDQTVVEISEVVNATIGDEVEIISSDSSATNCVTALASRSNVIPYEIVCGLGDRIDRVIVK